MHYRFWGLLDSCLAAIGERRKPAPDGSPGYLRVDSVHQGDLDGIKGVYLINAVDEVTSFRRFLPWSASAKPICCRCLRP